MQTGHGSDAKPGAGCREPTSPDSAGTHSSRKRNWNPEESSLLEQTLKSLTQRIVEGSLSSTIRPQTLRDLGGDCAAFYHAAFHRTSRPAWAIARFPDGFASLVEELNHRLKAHTITVSDSKSDVALYGKLVKDSLGAVRVFQDLVRSGEMNRDTALSELREDHGIVLSGAQQKYFFGSGEQPHHRQSATSGASLDERKLALAASIEKIKGQLGIDLSIRECVQGLVFEAFVGVYIAHRYGADTIVSQKRLPIAYRDLMGKPHRCVYLDYYRNDPTHPEVFEVKLRNSFEGIVTSAIPQLIAFEDLTQSTQTITVIYRHVSPQLHFSLDAGISIQPELERMGFDPVRLGGRRLDQLVKYIGIDDLLKGDPGARGFQETLGVLDTLISLGDVPLLKQYYDALLRISSTNEDLEGKMNLIRGLADNLAPITPEQAARLFGRRPARTDGGEEAEARVQMIRRGMASRRDSLLLDLFKELFGYEAPALDEAHIGKLEGVSEGEFQDAVMEVIGRREKLLLERASRGRPSKEERAAQLNRAYHFAVERERTRTQQELGVVLKHLAATYDVVRNSNNAANEKLASEVQRGAPAKAMVALRKEGLLKGRAGEKFVRELKKLHDNIEPVREIGKQALEALQLHLEVVAKNQSAIRSERKEFTDAIASLRGQVTGLLAKESSALKRNYALQQIEKWEKQFRKRPLHGDLVALQYVCESVLCGTQGFVRSFDVMCEFAIDLIDNLPICAVDLLGFSELAKHGARNPGTGVVGKWAHVAELVLRRLGFQINHPLALLHKPPSAMVLNEWIDKFPRLLSNSSVPPGSPERHYWGGSEHFSIVTSLRELFDGRNGHELERLEAVCMSLDAQAHWLIGMDMERLAQGSIFKNPDVPKEMAARDEQLSDMAWGLDRKGAFSFLLVNQYLARKTHQARIMSLFSVEKAKRFMTETQPILPKDAPYPSIFELYPVVKAASERDYEQFIDICSQEEL
jgi:hypothetical protein